MNRSITLADTVVAAPGQVAADIGTEFVILNVTSGEYFGLNAVGSRIWELIGEPRCVREIRDQLMTEYTDVSSEECTRDLLKLLTEMRAARLIDTTAEAAA